MVSIGYGVRLTLGWLVAAAALGSAPPAHGTETAATKAHRYAFWYNLAPSAADCPTALELRQRIVARLGRDPFVDAEPDADSILIGITRQAGGLYRARLTLRESRSDKHLERNFEDRSDNCRSLAEAVILGATLLLEGEPAWDPDDANAAGVEAPRAATDVAASRAAAEKPDASNRPPRAVTAPSKPIARPSVATVQSPPDDDDSQRTEREASHSRPRAELGVHALVSSGVVSNAPGWGMALSGILPVSDDWAIQWGADYQIAPSFQRALTSYQFSQTAAWLGAAWLHRPHQRLTFLLNSGLLLGVTHAAVMTRYPTDPGDHPLVGVRVGGQASLRVLGPLSLEAAAQARIPFARTIYRASGLTEEIWAQPGLGLAAELGLGLAFE